jgi:S-adenosylmethionine synthetase
MDLICRTHEGPPPGHSPVEIVERKGLGHPDTICDAIAEHVCVRLCRHYLERFGTILHHNVDKLLLAAGAARPAFGGGEVTAPMEIYIGGRAAGEPDCRGRRSQMINKHEVKGKVKNLKGRVQQGLGAASGNKGQEAEGLAKRVGGEAQAKVGQAKRGLKNLHEDNED